MLKIINARVFDGKELLPGLRRLTLEDQRITEVTNHHGTCSGLERDAGLGEVLDAGGMTVMPGMITGHFHPDFYKFDYSHPQGLERPPGVLMAIGVRSCRVLLESGFTGYLGASCGHDIDAQLKMAINEGIVPGPRIRTSGHHIGTTGDVLNKGNWWRRYGTVGTDLVADGPMDMRRVVREEISHGVEIIKVFAGSGHGLGAGMVRNFATDELAAIVDAAHERGARVRAHVAHKPLILECIDLGVDIIDHGDEVDEECIERMAAAGTFWVPSVIYLLCLLEIGLAAKRGITQAHVDHVRRHLPIAQRAGVRILVGDDYSGVFRQMLDDDPLDHEVGNYGREFAYYGAIDGLTPAEVLSWGTSNPGQLLADAPDKVGVVEQGALADLIIVDGDPLTDLSLLSRPAKSLKAVISNGAVMIDRLPSSTTAPSRDPYSQLQEERVRG